MTHDIKFPDCATLWPGRSMVLMDAFTDNWRWMPVDEAEAAGLLAGDAHLPAMRIIAVDYTVGIVTIELENETP